MKMILRVRALDFNYAEDGTVTDVNARFEVTDASGNFINGVIKVTNEEYEGTANLSEVATIVKAKIKTKINSL